MTVPRPTELADTRSAGIRRTAWILGACALTSYLLFLAMAMRGQ